MAASMPARKAPRLALEIMDLTDYNLTTASQIGVEELVIPFRKEYLEEGALQRVVQRVKEYGMRVSVIERLLPHDKIVHGRKGGEQQLHDILKLIQFMGKCGISVLCYNWMPADDWTRTSVTEKERGGALVSMFDAGVESKVHLQGQTHTEKTTSRAELWANLEGFLKRVVPIAEKNEVALALHADDPPMEEFHGKPQIVYDVESYLKVMKLVPSKANGICFAQGTLASRGEDIPKAIAALASHIKFIHFRDVTGKVPRFQETWTDNGKTNMAAAMRAFIQHSLDVPLRPDHVPTMVGEDNSTPGYHMRGRLFACGYIKGLRDASLEALDAVN